MGVATSTDAIAEAAYYGRRGFECKTATMVLTGTRSEYLSQLVNLAESLPIGTYEPLTCSYVPKRQRRLTPAEAVQVMLAYRAGGSMASIAHEHGVTRATVSHLLKRAAIPVREQRVLDQAGLLEAARLYESGMSLARVGDRLGFNTETIRHHLTRHGVVMRSPHGRTR